MSTLPIKLEKSAITLVTKYGSRRESLSGNAIEITYGSLTAAIVNRTSTLMRVSARRVRQLETDLEAYRSQVTLGSELKDIRLRLTRLEKSLLEKESA